jgi:hypothetical protein
VIQFDHTVAPTGNGITLLFRSLSREVGPIAWVDAHWGFGGPTEMNVRMKSTDGGFTWEWTEPNWPMRNGGAGLKFYFTYCVAGVDCDTSVFTLGGAPTAPIMQAPIQQYAPAPAPIVQAPVQQYAPAPAPIVAPLAPSYAPAPAPIMAPPAPSYNQLTAPLAGPRQCPGSLRI